MRILTQLNNTIGEKLDGVKELLDDDEESEKKVRRYYGRMFAVSQRLNSSLIGTVHIFNITTATVFATSSQFQKKEFTATLVQ